MTPRLALTLVLAVLLAVFVLQNTVIVELDLLFWSLRMSLALMVIFLIASGMVIGWALTTADRHRRAGMEKRAGHPGKGA